MINEKLAFKFVLDSFWELTRWSLVIFLINLFRYSRALKIEKLKYNNKIWNTNFYKILD